MQRAEADQKRNADTLTTRKRHDRVMSALGQKQTAHKLMSAKCQ
jgi:hypothetical protein